ncbi:MAG: DUF4954 family protein [Treponema sp.]|nr:DUF4954 family protein [Treponema sp.]
MVTITPVNKAASPEFPKDCLKNTRALTSAEIETLKKNRNHSDVSDWSNVLVSAKAFDPDLLYGSAFSGFVVLGPLRAAKVKYHDLELECGIYNSKLRDVVTGSDDAIHNVAYLENYRLGNGVILFNVQEMSCTKHSKFGNGILKQGESEDVRVWIGVANENDGRKVLPFESMIPADAYLWSRKRGDKALLKRFVELTESGDSKKNDTYGTVGNESVIKNTTLLKDAKIGDCAYIKGAFKLKNITVLSSAQEESQIGEGVEMVNGIMGYGSRVFYQAVAVRFVLGRNCQLKYGARLLNSILGDNSTVSCCELLNNLIFPFHEQHHNSSFLIATTVMGQSNIAAGATIGSNHNSRSPDGEIIAGRGFWPGLCSDFKHNSKFASFVLASKGSYQHELNISYPFSLIAAAGEDEPIQIMPAYWFMFNMFAIARNNYKFKKRDKRVVRVQHVETDPLAPDTMQQILPALSRIIELSKKYLQDSGYESVLAAKSEAQKLQAAKDFLHQNPNADFVLHDELCQKKYGAVILKPVKAYKEYRKIVKYFAARSLMEFCSSHKIKRLSASAVQKITAIDLYTKWTNAGGQIIPSKKVDELCAKIKAKKINSWQAVHAFYDACQESYGDWKARYSIYLLEQLYSRKIQDFTKEIFKDIIADVTVVSNDMLSDSYYSRKKDYDDPFRQMTYGDEEEMTAVLGSLNDNSFLRDLKAQTALFNERLNSLF